MRLPVIICALAAIPAAAQTTPAVPTWTVSAQPTLEIGDDADPRKQFTRIGRVARLSDGSIVVANGESQELRLFSVRGEYLRYPAASPTYLVIDRGGRAAARVNLPRGFAVHHIGSDFVIGVRRDDDGVEHVARYALQRR
jgi:hypothetical protein